jgi:acid phosphatase (class B)
VQAVVSHGDSDGDIRESIEAGARPVRVLRARTSVNAEPVHNGAFGEEVLLNSEF